MPASSVLCGLISCTSFFMSHAEVTVSETRWSEPLIAWILTVMPTGSGKSTLFKFLYNIVEDVKRRTYNKEDLETHDWVVGECSIERLGFTMAENGNKLLGMFDEISHFLTQMNILKNKGQLSDTQELSTLLQLYNGFPWTRKTVTRECNFTMPSTSFILSGFTQPVTASLINRQSGSAEKGLSSRFLWLSPKPVFSELTQIKELDADLYESICELFLHMASQWEGNAAAAAVKKVYEVDPQQCKVFEAYFNKCQQTLERLAGQNEVVAGIISKSKGQVLRLAGILNGLFMLGEEDLEIKSSVSAACCEAAVNFVECCIDHALYLSGKQSLREELELLELADNVIPGQIRPPTELSNTEFTILLPGQNLYLTALIDGKKFRKRGNKEGALAAMRELEKIGLGTLSSEGKGRSQKFIFKKKEVPSDSDLEVEFVGKLLEVGVSLEQYIRAYNEEDVLPPNMVRLESRDVGEKDNTRSDSELRRSPRKAPRCNEAKASTSSAIEDIPVSQ